MQLAAFTADHFPLGQAAMQVNEGLPAYIVVGARAPLRRPAAARPSASSAWRSRPSPTTRARRSATSCASCCRGPARASLCTDPYVEDDRLVTARVRPRRERHPVLGAPHKRVPRPRASAARTSSTSGARLGERDPAVVREGPRHRRGRVHQRLPRPGAARRRPRGRRARRLQQVRAGWRSRTTTTRATASSRATPRTRR